MKSFYCRRCQVLVDESQIDTAEIQDDNGRVVRTYYAHLVDVKLPGGTEGYISHEVVVEP